MKRKGNPPFARFDRGRYPPGYLAIPHPESEVQGEILDLLSALRILALPIDAGARTLRGRAFGALVRAGRRDLTSALVGKTGAGTAGLPDIWGIIPPKGRALLIEVKSPALIVRGKIEKDAGDLSEAQSAFLANAQDKGAIAIVAWAIWDVTDVFRRLGLIH